MRGSDSPSPRSPWPWAWSSCSTSPSSGCCWSQPWSRARRSDFSGPARVAFSADLVGREQLGNAIALSLPKHERHSNLCSVVGRCAGRLGRFSASVVRIWWPGATSRWWRMVVLLRLPAFPGTRMVARPRPRWRQRTSRWRSRSVGTSLRPAGGDDRRCALRGSPNHRCAVWCLTSFFIVMFGFNYVAFYPAMVEGVSSVSTNAWVGYISSASALGAVSVSLFRWPAEPTRAWAKIGHDPRRAFFFGHRCDRVRSGPGTSGSPFAIIGLCRIGANTVYQTLSNTMALESWPTTAHQGRVQSLMQLSFAGFGIAAAPTWTAGRSHQSSAAAVVLHGGCHDW